MIWMMRRSVLGVACDLALGGVPDPDLHDPPVGVDWPVPGLALAMCTSSWPQASLETRLSPLVLR